MSDPLRIAVVAEGPTDTIVIKAILNAVGNGSHFIVTQLQPEGSVAFGALGGGWSGVYHWCKQSTLRGQGRLAGDELLFLRYDLLIIHLDADVAGVTYQSAQIDPQPMDPALPCEADCPPASTTVLALRQVLLGWCGESVAPQRLVLCNPSKNTEAWVVAALFPLDSVVTAGQLECHSNPENRLGQQPRKQRIRKSQADYHSRSDQLSAGWPTVVKQLGEAQRFDSDLRAAL